MISSLPILYKSEIGLSNPPTLRLCEFWHINSQHIDTLPKYNIDELIQHETFGSYDIQSLFEDEINIDRILDDSRSIFDLDNYFNVYIRKITDRSIDSGFAYIANKL